MEKKFEFKPFDKVLVRVKGGNWHPDFYWKTKGGECFSIAGGISYSECIPYEGNEHLLGTSDPYEPPYEPKKGDFIEFFSDKELWIAIYDEIKNGKLKVYACTCGDYSGIQRGFWGDIDCIDCGVIRKATDDNRETLLKVFHEAGKDWDAERMEIVDYKWKPKEGEDYYRPTLSETKFEPYQGIWCAMKFESVNYERGWVFQTKEECQALCDKLNEATKNIK